MTTTTLQTIPRDRFNRPMVLPPNGGKPVSYTRCTTYVGCLEDTYNLGQWMQRMVAIGLASRPDLLLAVSAHSDDKAKLNKIVDDAREAAAANAAATTGTALHALTERIDRGQDVGVIPEQYKPDLAAYEKATASLTALMIEQFCVDDDLRIGGTPDRVVEFEGANYIADVKTGSIEYGALKIAMQLAVYAHCRAYDHHTGQRTDLPNVSTERAIVIHLPAGTGTAELVWVDIKTGWEAVQVATQVRDWRKRKGLLVPLVPAKDGPTKTVDLDNLIASAATVDALTALWVRHSKTWTTAHTELAASRKALLLGDDVA